MRKVLIALLSVLLALGVGAAFAAPPPDATPCERGSAGEHNKNCVVDTDNDGVPDDSDNCPSTPNADQTDSDGDGIGDACEADSDGDGVIDDNDNCPSTPNADQTDSDGDGIGDACEADSDGDGVIDDNDNCPSTPNADQTDSDGDGIGDACEADSDGDGVIDDNDNCPSTPNSDQTDTDGDGIGDACDEGGGEVPCVEDGFDFLRGTDLEGVGSGYVHSPGEDVVGELLGPEARDAVHGLNCEAVVQAENAVDGLLAELGLPPS